MLLIPLVLAVFGKHEVGDTSVFLKYLPNRFVVFVGHAASSGRTQRFGGGGRNCLGLGAATLRYATISVTYSV